VAEPLPADAVTPVGALGAVMGVALAVTPDELPESFVATTVAV